MTDLQLQSTSAPTCSPKCISDSSNPDKTCPPGSPAPPNSSHNLSITVTQKPKHIYFLQQNVQTTNKLPPCIVQSIPNGFQFSNANESNRVHLLNVRDSWPPKQVWNSTVAPPSFYTIPPITKSNQILNISIDVNLQAAGSGPGCLGAECGSVLAIYLVPTRKTPPVLVDAKTHTCTDFYTDGANLCGNPSVQKTCGVKGIDCFGKTPCPANVPPCGLYQQLWSCAPGPKHTTGCNMGVELDLFEGNKYGFQCTTHNCTGLKDPASPNYQPECDQWGNIGKGYIPRAQTASGFAAGWKVGKNFGPNDQYIIDSTKKFTVSADLSLDSLNITLIQNNTKKFSYGALTFMGAVGNPLSGIQHALKKGDLSLIFSYWGNADPNTCDSQGKNCGIKPDSVWLTKEGAGGGPATKDFHWGMEVYVKRL